MPESSKDKRGTAHGVLFWIEVREGIERGMNAWTAQNWTC